MPGVLRPKRSPRRSLLFKACGTFGEFKRNCCSTVRTACRNPAGKKGVNLFRGLGFHQVQSLIALLCFSEELIWLSGFRWDEHIVIAQLNEKFRPFFVPATCFA